MASPETSRNDRRRAARDLARAERERIERRGRRLRVLIPVAVTAVILAIAGGVTAAIVTAQPPTATAAQTPAHLQGDAIVFAGDGGRMTFAATGTGTTSGVPRIDTYLDLQCPYCNQFETTNASRIADLVAAGEATLAIHPIAILDRASNGARYSSRAANAIAAVTAYQPEAVPAVLAALYARQPAEQTPGLTDRELAAIVRDAGATDSRIADAIRTERYAAWVTAATARAANDPDLINPRVGSFTTPTVLVDGDRFEGAPTDADAFARFVDAHR